MVYYINGRRRTAAWQIGSALSTCISSNKLPTSEIVILCIGTDRMTGDCLGPYVGYTLSSCHLPETYIYGTLDHPVHALNLRSVIRSVTREHPQALVIAVDASVDAKRHLGYITVGNGCIHPGAAVGKSLPPVGDIYITGIVCSYNEGETVHLENTRLASVIHLARTITDGILYFYQIADGSHFTSREIYANSFTCL